MKSPRDTVIAAGDRTAGGWRNGRQCALFTVGPRAWAIRCALDGLGPELHEGQPRNTGPAVQEVYGPNPTRRNRTTARIGWDVNAIAAATNAGAQVTVDLELDEINKAFGDVSRQSRKHLDCPLEKTIIDGGEIALGHGLGALGVPLALGAAPESKQRGSGKTALSHHGGRGDALPASREAQQA